MGKCTSPFKWDSLYSFELYLCLSKFLSEIFDFRSFELDLFVEVLFTVDLMFFFFTHREMCLWDISDGRCVENTKMPHIHTNMQVTLLLIPTSYSLIDSKLSLL